ncbi:hypothetical protein LWM68_20025 [Niabella sp. W65]|nr:hypothetical protein [Niabella sp. W65]MCH7364845.1 hypothetical protein [Niabella sp. W65]
MQSPGAGIENVLFKNIVYNGTKAELSMIAGYDSSRLVKNITFENLLINGKRLPITCPVSRPGIKQGYGPDIYWRTCGKCSI